MYMYESVKSIKASYCLKQAEEGKFKEISILVRKLTII